MMKPHQDRALWGLPTILPTSSVLTFAARQERFSTQQSGVSFGGANASLGGHLRWLPGPGYVGRLGLRNHVKLSSSSKAPGDEHILFIPTEISTVATGFEGSSFRHIDLLGAEKSSMPLISIFRTDWTAWPTGQFFSCLFHDSCVEQFGPGVVGEFYVAVSGYTKPKLVYNGL